MTTPTFIENLLSLLKYFGSFLILLILIWLPAHFSLKKILKLPITLRFSFFTIFSALFFSGIVFILLNIFTSAPDLPPPFASLLSGPLLVFIYMIIKFHKDKRTLLKMSIFLFASLIVIIFGVGVFSMAYEAIDQHTRDTKEVERLNVIKENERVVAETPLDPELELATKKMNKAFMLQALASLRLGVAQEVIVTIDAKSVSDQVKKMQEANRGIDYSEILAFKTKAYNAIKAEITSAFPLGDVSVISNYDVLPIFFIKISTEAALRKFLALPQVLSVEENRQNVAF